MKLYEEQSDGTLKPVELPVELAKKAHNYLELRSKALSLEEIKWIVNDSGRLANAD